MQPLQMLYDNKPELNDPDISFAFFEMIGSDDLLKLLVCLSENRTVLAV